MKTGKPNRIRVARAGQRVLDFIDTLRPTPIERKHLAIGLHDFFRRVLKKPKK